MKLVSARDLQKDKYYMYYRVREHTQSLLIFHTLDSLTDRHKHGSGAICRWAIRSNCYVDYTMDVTFGDVDLQIIDPDDYVGDLQFKDIPETSFWELTDEEAYLHIIATSI